MSKVDYSQFFYKSEDDNQKDLQVLSPDEITYYPKKRKTGKGKSKTIAVLGMILCFCATLLLCDYFSGGYILADFDQSVNASEKSSYYCVQTGIYSDLKTAELYAENVKSRGGAGYVYYDGMYRVVASLYTGALQAKTVAEKMEQVGIDATVFSISHSPFSDNSLSAQNRDELNSLSTYADYCYQTLYNLSNELDTGKTSKNDIISSLNALITYLENSRTKAEKIEFSSIANALSSKIKGAIEIIKNVSQTVNSSSLRYAYCSIIFNYN